jgi:glycosyltransferase involved in cell wall biosynthesis
MIKNLLYLTKVDPSYGNHASYYTQIPLHQFHNLKISTVFSSKPTFLSKVTGKAYNLFMGINYQDTATSAAQVSFLCKSRLERNIFCHILNPEDHLSLLRNNLLKKKITLITTHFPPSHWNESDLLLLKNLASIITLCTRDQKFFSNFIDPSRVHFIPHGVHSSFFKPDISLKNKTPRIIFVGKWLRDFATAAKVLESALIKWPRIEVDIVCSKTWLKNTALFSLLGHPRVSHFQDIDDSTLQRLYQMAWFILLPLYDTSANNALCESLSSGVIPLINDVGGVCDYGGSTIYPVVKSSNAKDYLDLLSYYLSHPAERISCSNRVQLFANDQLDWEHIYAEHLRVYQSLVSLES